MGQTLAIGCPQIRVECFVTIGRMAGEGQAAPMVREVCAERRRRLLASGVCKRANIVGARLCRFAGDGWFKNSNSANGQSRGSSASELAKKRAPAGRFRLDRRFVFWLRLTRGRVSVGGIGTGWVGRKWFHYFAPIGGN